MKIGEFCAKDARHIEIVSGEGFRALAQHLVMIGASYGNIDIHSILPHPTTVSRNIFRIHKTLHAEVFPAINQAIESEECSSTTDMWTEKYKNNPFLTMTVHFFDEDFVLKKQVLFTSKYTQRDKTGISVLNELMKQFENVRFRSESLKKIHFVTDHGSNMVKALKGLYIRDDCRAHRLNTILANTFESEDVPLVFTKIIKSCKNIVRHLKQSEKMNQLSKTLVQECKTRWNTKLEMIESIICQYAEVMELLPHDLCIKWAFDVALARRVVQFLTPFKEATKSLEGDTYPTACKVLLWWEHLSKHLNEENFECEPMKILGRVATKFFTAKYPIDMNNKIACFLDPRYRFLKMLPKIDRDEVYEEIKLQLEDTPNECEPPPAKRTRLSCYEEGSEDFRDIDEFEAYMQTANYTEYLHSSQKVHLVELFWRSNKNRFPKLYKMAKRRLHVPASSGSSERNFSDAGRVCNKSRANTKPDQLDKLLFLKANMKL